MEKLMDGVKNADEFTIPGGGVVPTAILVGVTPLFVERVKELKDGEGQPCAGLYVPQEGKIKLDWGMPASYEQVTLAHELIHALLAQAGLGDMFGNLLEPLCDALGNSLPMLLRDNPALRDYLATPLQS